MKRRKMLQSALGVSAASALSPLAFSQETRTPEGASRPAAIEENPQLKLTVADAVAPGVPKFFDANGLAALGRLAEILVPAEEADCARGQGSRSRRISGFSSS